MNQPWVYMCSPSWTPLPLPPHPIPQGHPSAPALSTLSHESSLDWRSVSHVVIRMFQCYSLKPSHPRLLPQSPKVCSLHLCLFFCADSLLQHQTLNHWRCFDYLLTNLFYSLHRSSGRSETGSVFFLVLFQPPTQCWPGPSAAEWLTLLWVPSFLWEGTVMRGGLVWRAYGPVLVFIFH